MDQALGNLDNYGNPSEKKQLWYVNQHKPTGCLRCLGDSLRIRFFRPTRPNLFSKFPSFIFRVCFFIFRVLFLISGVYQKLPNIMLLRKIIFYCLYVFIIFTWFSDAVYYKVCDVTCRWFETRFGFFVATHFPQNCRLIFKNIMYFT